MPFVHPNPLNQRSTPTWTLINGAADYIVVPAVANHRIIVKSVSFNGYGPGGAAIDIIDRLGGSDVNVATDYLVGDASIQGDADDDGVIETRAGAALVIKSKSALVINVRLNYWYSP